MLFTRASFLSLWIVIFSASCSAFTTRSDDTRHKVRLELADETRTCENIPLGPEKDKLFLAGYALYRMTRFDPEVQKGRKSRIILTGDSTAALFVEEVMSKYAPGLEIANRGIGGDTSFLLRVRILTDVIPLAPQTVIVIIGGNDIINGRCFNRILENTAEIGRLLRSQNPPIQPVFVSIPPVVNTQLNEITPIYNKRLKEFCAQNGYGFIDLWDILADPERKALRPEFRIVYGADKVDQIHFNEQGYSEFGKLLLKRFGKK